VDLRERRQLDVTSQMAKLRARTGPWRSIIAVALAIAAATVSHEYGRHPLGAELSSADRLISTGTAVAFLLFGLTATTGLSGKAKDALQPRIGSTHSAMVRIVLVLIGVIVAVTVALSLFGLPVTQLVLGGAIIGVLLGIAAQQTLANLFAGIVLLQARPFGVGDDVWIRSGALGGQYDGTVVEVGLTYVRLRSANGLIALPNTQVLAAATGPAKPADAGLPPPV
jgi:small-conductance mechanosensitive channel